VVVALIPPEAAVVVAEVVMVVIVVVVLAALAVVVVIELEILVPGNFGGYVETGPLSTWTFHSQLHEIMDKKLTHVGQ
jgi:hypothetical protein